MCQHRRPKSGMTFFSDGCTTDLIATFEYERLVSGLGQVKRGDQAVVAATNNDDVVRARHSMLVVFPLCFPSVKFCVLCGWLFTLASKTKTSTTEGKEFHRGKPQSKSSNLHLAKLPVLTAFPARP